MRDLYVTFIWGGLKNAGEYCIIKAGAHKEGHVVGRAGCSPKILFHNVHLHGIVFQCMELA